MDLNDTTPLKPIETRLDRIEAKLDDHLARVSVAERDISYLRGHVQIATTIFLAVVGAMAASLWKLISPK